MTTGTERIESAKSLLGRRPAETATAAAGAIGLLLSGLLQGGENEDLRTGLVVLLAALPAVVSYVYDLGAAKRLPHDLGREIEELSLRGLRRFRLGHGGWQNDLDAATQLAELRKSLAPPAQGSATANASSSEQPR